MRRFLIATTVLLAAFWTACSSPAIATGISARDASYVLIPADKTSATMSGSLEDYQRAKALRVGKEGLLYMRKDGVVYVIRDRDLLKQATVIFRPQEALGTQQAALGSRQEVLGQQQAELGVQQGRLGRRQVDASPRLAASLAREQDALGRQQAELGDQQEVLGQQQEALGRRQETASRVATEKLDLLLAAALRDGRVQRLNSR